MLNPAARYLSSIQSQKSQASGTIRLVEKKSERIAEGEGSFAFNILIKSFFVSPLYAVFLVWLTTLYASIGKNYSSAALELIFSNDEKFDQCRERSKTVPSSQLRFGQVMLRYTQQQLYFGENIFSMVSCSSIGTALSHTRSKLNLEEKDINEIMGSGAYYWHVNGPCVGKPNLQNNMLCHTAAEERSHVFVLFEVFPTQECSFQWDRSICSLHGCLQFVSTPAGIPSMQPLIPICIIDASIFNHDLSKLGIIICGTCKAMWATYMCPSKQKLPWSAGTCWTILCIIVFLNRILYWEKVSPPLNEEFAQGWGR